MTLQLYEGLPSHAWSEWAMGEIKRVQAHLNLTNPEGLEADDV